MVLLVPLVVVLIVVVISRVGKWYMQMRQQARMRAVLTVLNGYTVPVSLGVIVRLIPRELNQHLQQCVAQLVRDGLISAENSCEVHRGSRSTVRMYTITAAGKVFLQHPARAIRFMRLV